MEFNHRLNVAVLSCVSMMINSGNFSLEKLTSEETDHEQLEKLPQLPLSYFNELAHELGGDFIHLDFDVLVSKLQLTDIPIECQNFLKRGASNKLMLKYFGTNHNKCSDWRKKIKIEKGYKRKQMSPEEYCQLWDELTHLNQFPPRKKILIHLSDKYKVNISKVYEEAVLSNKSKLKENL